jgi:hypothetical protein
VSEGAGPEDDATERLLFTVLRRFEALALSRYERDAPALATAAKRALVAALDERARGDAALEASELGRPVEALLATLREGGPTSTLLVQGFVLERLGRAIYAVVAGDARSGPAARALAESGLRASEQAAAAAGRLLEEGGFTGAALYDALSRTARPALARLDALGEGVDAAFAERYRLRFADLMGELAADLIEAGLALGLERRKLVCFLAGALMGR